jgi:hypothetical protein
MWSGAVAMLVPPGLGWPLPRALLRHRRMARPSPVWGNEPTRSFKSARDADAVAIRASDTASRDAGSVGSSPIQTVSAVQGDFPPCVMRVAPLSPAAKHETRDRGRGG